MKGLELDYWALQPDDLLRIDEHWWLVTRTFYASGHQVEIVPTWLLPSIFGARKLSDLFQIRGSTTFEVTRPEGEPLEWVLAFLLAAH